jgi:hypothetical protein
MSLVFYSGFDYYDTPQINRIWPYYSNGTSISPGRFGGRAWGWNNQGGYLAATIPNSSTVIVGMAFSIAYGDPTNPILLLQDATTSTSNPITQVDLRVTTDAGFQITRNGTIIATTQSHLFAFGFWNYLEFRTDINNSSGYVEIRINGQSLFTLGSLNTKYSGNGYANMIRVQPFGNTGQFNFKIDDMYVLNNGGSVNNQFLGECRVQTQYPVANGELNQFSAIGAASNWQAVDELTPDDDTTFVRSGVVGNVDDYQMGSVSLSGTIYGIQLNVMHRKDDVGTRTIAPIIRSSSTYYEGNQFICQSDYTVAQKIWEQEPHSLTTWTNGSVNAITAGIKIKA